MAIIDVVKYNGSPNVFAWKYPSEELGTWTQLVVNESQEVILFKGGQALDLFKSGTHTLSTENIPFIRNLINLPFGGRSPFTAEVWYINKVHSLDIKWGTKTPIQLQDPKYKIFVPIRSFGQFGIQIDNSRKFLVKLVGTMNTFDKENLLKYFRGVFMTKVKDLIASYLVHKQISVLEISAYLDEISQYACEKITPIMDEYGIKIVNFYINSINFPEEDTGVIQLKQALAKRAEMDIIGYNYTQERSFDTLEGAAKNEGSMSSNLMGAGIGLGMGVGIGGGIATPISSVAQNLNTSPVQKQCPKCNMIIDQNQRFCGHCGFDTNSQIQDNKTQDILCNNCGNKLLDGAKFCPNCGMVYNPCPNCKASLKENAKTCDVCGYKLSITCPNCNEKVDSDAKFCCYCGHSMVSKCSECGMELPEGTKFCYNCGKKYFSE